MIFLKKSEIINDTQIDNGFYIYGENKKPAFVYLKKGNTDTITLNTRKFTLKKEDIWEHGGAMNIFLLLLYSLDLIFGNMADSVNLPYYINEQFDFENTSENEKIYLSKIMKAKENSIDKWKITATVQQLFCCLLLMCVGVAVSFLFKGLYRIISIAAILLLCVYLYIRLCSRKRALYKYLNQFRLIQ